MSEDKQLIEKAIYFKGKDYVLVKDRILYFNETYPNGSIKTSYLRNGNCYEFQAEIYPHITEQKDRVFMGHSQAIIGDGYINTTSAMENAETSAVGRALAMMGIGVIDSIASADEIKKAEMADKKKNLPFGEKKSEVSKISREVTEEMKAELKKVANENKWLNGDIVKIIGQIAPTKHTVLELTKEEYDKVFKKLSSPNETP